MSEQVPSTCSCISCGKILEVDNHYPPSELTLGKDELEVHSPIGRGMYLAFESYGNYGSRVHDYSGYKIQGYLCDECFIQKADRLYTWPIGENSNRPCIGTRLSTHPDYGENLKKMEVFGPSFLMKNASGEYWIDGVRDYREVTSEQRSEAEGVLLSQKEAEVRISRELLNHLLGGLREAEYNRIEVQEIVRKMKWENELLKRQIAGEPRGKDIQALLHKEASELTIKELKEMKELARWGAKIQDWMYDHDLRYEDGTEVDVYRLWIELTRSAEEFRKWEEDQKRGSEILDAYVACCEEENPKGEN